MKKGDILLVKYKYDTIAWIIRKVTKSTWNHTAWAVDNCHIIEVRGGGLKVSHIRRYLKKNKYTVKLVRIKGIKKDCLKQAIEYCQGLNQSNNYLKWLWTIILMGLNYNKQLPKITCSGLIAISLSTINYYFRKDKSLEYITPKDIENGRGVYNVSNEL